MLTGKGQPQRFDKDVQVLDGIMFELEDIVQLARGFETFDDTEGDESG